MLTQEQLDNIAQTFLTDVNTLKTQNNSKDFFEVAVWQLREALQAAYVLGTEIT